MQRRYVIQGNDDKGAMAHLASRYKGVLGMTVAENGHYGNRNERNGRIYGNDSRYSVSIRISAGRSPDIVVAQRRVLRLFKIPIKSEGHVITVEISPVRRNTVYGADKLREANGDYPRIEEHVARSIEDRRRMEETRRVDDAFYFIYGILLPLGYRQEVA